MLPLVLALLVAQPIPPHPQVRDEGVLLGRPDSINFVGPSVSCTGNNAATTCVITGVGGTAPGGTAGRLQINDGSGGFGAYGGSTCASGTFATSTNGNGTWTCAAVVTPEPPDCNAAGKKLLYTLATHSWSCVDETSMGGGGPSVTDTVDFGCQTGGDCTTVSTTLSAAWILQTTKLACGIHTGTADHPTGDDDAFVEGVSVLALIQDGGGSVAIAATAANYTWGTWNVTCQEIL
jgi:hypothetical protein